MVVVVGAITGDVGGLVGDMALLHLGPGLLLLWVTSMWWWEASLLLWAPRLVGDMVCMPWSLLAMVAVGG